MLRFIRENSVDVSWCLRRARGRRARLGFRVWSRGRVVLRKFFEDEFFVTCREGWGVLAGGGRLR